ncbi:MAG: aspartyl protease family protein [Candidatus Thorarchaeota archaeon]|jgi:predicted aspartyl protease
MDEIGLIKMEIKFEIGQGSGHPHVPVYVNGKGPYTFTLDTGATATTISPQLAEELGIETYEGDKAFATGVGGGKIDVSFAKVDSFKVGAEKVEDEEVMVIDFDSAMGCFTPGVIGHTFLKNYRIHVNYRTKTMMIVKQSDTNSGDEGDLHWVDFEYAEDTHLVTVPTYVNGEGPFNLVVDTGSGGTVITPNLADKLGLSREQGVGDIQVKSLTSDAGADGCADGCQGIGGFAPAYAIQAKEFKVGSKTQENPILAVIDLKDISPRGLVIHDGIIGYPFLNDLELIIDYPNKKIAFLQEEQNN